jgi:UDP-N-acetylglucosamine 1-carboxyvinyltransferase
MRSSVIFLGALLARKKEAAAVSPGGCVLGERPIDFHLEGFRQLGCLVECREHQPVRITTTGMQAASIRLPFPSVGATENILLAASGAEGTTLIENAAKEPEILELSRFLEQMGFQIHGAGTSRISIRGKSVTRDVRFQLSGDRIVAGTWLLCCMSAGGSICLDQAPVPWMEALLHTLRQMGAEIWTEGNLVVCTAPKKILPIASLETAPYPGFPTDMQSQLLPVLCRAEGESLVHEHIFSSRFRVAEELNRMGADIRVSKDQSCARIAGNALLHGASVTAPDLRGGAALIIAAMGAQGDTIIDDFYHVERGYERITDMIGILGGETCWIDKRDIK